MGTHLVLKSNTSFTACFCPEYVEVGTFLKRIIPNKSADDNNADGINKKGVVEYDKTDGDMVPLHNGAYGNRKRD